MTAEKWTVLLQPIQAHGKWDKQEPFGQPNLTNYEGPVAVLTRATINLNRLKNFWQNAEKIAAIMTAAPGYITSMGVGEDPFRHQATISFWEDLELFARFVPLKAWGTLRGKNSLQGFVDDPSTKTNASFTG